MYSFEGNYKAKRHINLGGRKVENKDELLQKTIRQRKERESERRRLTAAQTIQERFSQIRASRGARDILRKLFDQDTEEMLGVKTPAKEFFALQISRMSRFYHRHLDRDRVRQLCAVLRACANDPTSWTDLASICPWSARTFVSVVYDVCLSGKDDSHDCYWVFLTGTPYIISKAGLLRHQSFYRMLRHLPALYASDNGQSSQTAVQNAFQITLASAKSSVHDDFIENVLCEVEPSKLDLPESGLNIGVSISYLSQSDTARISLHQQVRLVSNLYHLVLGQKKVTLEAANVAPFICCVAELLANIRYFVQTSISPSGDPNTVSELENGEESDDRSQVRKIVQDFGSEFESCLIGFTALPNMNWIISNSRTDHCPVFARFFSDLLYVLPDRRTDMLMSLSLTVFDAGQSRIGFLPFCWQLIKSTPIFSTEGSDFLANTLTEDAHAYQWLLLKLFVEVYTRVLLTMIDEEFFDPARNSLTIQDVLQLSILLKNVTVVLFLNRPEVRFDKFNDFSSFRNVATKLLQQLFRRDSRRRFTPENHWLVTSKVNMDTFVSAVLSEAKSVGDELADDTVRSHAPFGSSVMSASKSRLQNFYSTRLSILNECPFFLPFTVRINILQQLILLDKERRGLVDFWHSRRHRATIRREHAFTDGFDAFYNLGSGFKADTEVTFVDPFGQQELGIDGGGLTKEFLTSTCNQVFAVEYGLFSETDDNLLYPNPQGFNQDARSLQYYEFLGMIIGKCIYSGILVDAQFAPFFILKWLGKASYLDDLAGMDRELYQGLVYLKHYAGDVESDFSLNFTVTDEELGKVNTIELVPGGANVPVTNQNRLQYIHLVSNYRLNVRLSKQSAAFVQGLSRLVDQRWLSMFNQQEIQSLVGGASVSINLEDLRNNTTFYGFEDRPDFEELFWNVLSELGDEERRNLVKFVTSVAKPPLLGFKGLNPPFAIRRDEDDFDRLPTASTCVNLLKLPAYKNKADLRRKLQVAIEQNTGFGFN